MSERQAFKDIWIRLAICIVFATLWCLGGWGEFLGGAKWLRRFVAPLELSVGLFYFSRDWKSFITAPLLMIGGSLGYGGDDTLTKVIKRAYCGLILGIGSTAISWSNKRFVFTAFQTILVVMIMIYLGVYNPLADARAEEFSIGLLISFLPVMAVRRKVKSSYPSSSPQHV